MKCILATASLCVCLSLAALPHYCTVPDVTCGNVRGCPLVVHCWTDLQSVHRFCCYDNIQVCMLIALYTANMYSTKSEMSVSACTGCVADFNLSRQYSTLCSFTGCDID